MASASFSGTDIAERQLLAAIRLWKEEDYIPAICLAGAAEEILGKRLRAAGYQPSFDTLRETILEIAGRLGDSGPNAEKLISDLMNQTKNEVKHYAGDEPLEFDMQADASEMLERAICNYTLLMNHVLPEFLDFYGSSGDTDLHNTCIFEQKYEE